MIIKYIIVSKNIIQSRSWVRKDIMMDLEGSHAYCMFISIGLLPLDECEHAQYDDECECAQCDDEGAHETHDTMGFR